MNIFETFVIQWISICSSVYFRTLHSIHGPLPHYLESFYSMLYYLIRLYFPLCFPFQYILATLQCLFLHMNFSMDLTSFIKSKSFFVGIELSPSRLLNFLTPTSIYFLTHHNVYLRKMTPRFYIDFRNDITLHREWYSMQCTVK